LLCLLDIVKHITYKSMRFFKINIAICSIAIATIAILGVGCSSLTKTQKGTAIGAGAGGTVGALIGRAAGNTALGAIIGGAVGGTAGAFIGSKMDKQAAEIKQTVPGATVIRAGEGIVVKFDSGILFDTDSANLKPSAQTNLQNLATSMQKNPQTNISIIGYTDSIETADHDLDLSIRRAQSVKTYIVAAGVSDARLTTAGKGQADPIATNSTPEGRALNRRVEIIITANTQLKNQAEQNGGQ